MWLAHERVFLSTIITMLKRPISHSPANTITKKVWTSVQNRRSASFSSNSSSDSYSDSSSDSSGDDNPPIKISREWTALETPREKKKPWGEKSRRKVIQIPYVIGTIIYLSNWLVSCSVNVASILWTTRLMRRLLNQHILQHSCRRFRNTWIYQRQLRVRMLFFHSLNDL